MPALGWLRRTYTHMHTHASHLPVTLDIHLGFTMPFLFPKCICIDPYSIVCNITTVHYCNSFLHTAVCLTALDTQSPHCSWSNFPKLVFDHSASLFYYLQSFLLNGVQIDDTRIWPSPFFPLNPLAISSHQTWDGSLLANQSEMLLIFGRCHLTGTSVPFNWYLCSWMCHFLNLECVWLPLASISLGPQFKNDLNPAPSSPGRD